MPNIINDDFKNTLISRPGAENLLGCLLCGTCTAGCPISEVDAEFNPRKIMRQVLAGMKHDVLSSDVLWRCYQCHTCVAHCPQDVRFADVIRALRDAAIEENHFSRDIAENVTQLDIEARKQRLEKIRNLFNT